MQQVAGADGAEAVRELEQPPQQRGEERRRHALQAGVRRDLGRAAPLEALAPSGAAGLAKGRLAAQEQRAVGANAGANGGRDGGGGTSGGSGRSRPLAAWRGAAAVAHGVQPPPAAAGAPRSRVRGRGPRRKRREPKRRSDGQHGFADTRMERARRCQRGTWLLLCCVKHKQYKLVVDGLQCCMCALFKAAAVAIGSEFGGPRSVH